MERSKFRTGGMTLHDSNALRVKHPGVLEPVGAGPDFKDAVISVDGVDLVCDVEIHLHARDWVYHGHHEDPNFDKVGLHVVLFEPRDSQLEPRLPLLVVGPYLPADIESCILGQFESSQVGLLFEAWAELDPHQIRRKLAFCMP